MSFVKIDTEKINKSVSVLSHIKDGAQKAVYRAMNRAAQSAKSKAPAYAGEEYTLKRSDVKKTLSIKKASIRNLSTELKSTSRKTPLGLFRHRPNSDTTGKNRRKVFVSVRKDTKSVISRGFVWKGHIFRRKYKHGRELEKPLAPAIPSLLEAPLVTSNIQKQMQETFDKRLKHEVDAIYKGFSK